MTVLTLKQPIHMSDNSVSFCDIQIKDYVSCKRLLSFLTKKNEEFSFDLFSKLCSSLHSDYRIICCFYNDIEAGTQIMVGMGTLLIEHKLIHNGSCVGHIEDIVVDGKYRNMKFGKKIIDELVNIAKEKQAYKVILNCNEEKIGFYQKCGFHKSNVEMRINI